MRIVAGKYGGRRLLTPKNQDIRPTSDKIRGAIFNALHSRGALNNAYAMDLFCGTGALGIEALSRGAQHCVFIDKSKTSLKIARDNASTLKIPEEDLEFIQNSALTLAPRPENIPPRSLIFCDPPYHQNLITPALRHIHDTQWLAQDALVIIETEKSEILNLPNSYNIESEKIYGDTRISFAHFTLTPP